MKRVNRLIVSCAFLVVFVTHADALSLASETAIESGNDNVEVRPPECEERLLPKMPWQMTRQEWRDAGSPDLGLEAILVSEQKSYAVPGWRPPWSASLREEIQAINDYLGVFQDPMRAFRSGAGVSDPESQALPDRQHRFASQGWGHKNWSSFHNHKPGSSEDVREAIIVGRKLGYRDEDILYYVVRNYIIAPFMPELKERMRALGWAREKEALQGTWISPEIKRWFPVFRSFEKFIE